MDLIYQDIPRIYTALAEWSACLIYLSLVEKRFKKWKVAGISAVALVIQSMELVLTENFPMIFWIPCMILAAGCMYVYLFTAGKLTPLGAGYCCAKAFLLAEFAASLEWQIHTYLRAIGMKNQVLLFLLIPIVYSLVFFLNWKLEKPFLTEAYLKQLTLKEFLSAAGIVIAVFAFSNMSFVLESSPFTSQLQADIFNIRTIVDLGGIAILYAFQSRIGEYMAEKEVTAIETMLKSQYDQYRSYQESMELIHIKYHDLKHQIAGLRAETDADRRKEWLDTMERELEQNELSQRTENQVLDTMLGVKMLQARKNHIRITCVADGHLLDFMHVTDICTIFGNALDNAVESVVLIPDEEKRLIHVSVTEQKQFVFIQISNYCERKIQLENGTMPETTKADKKNHGFGLKSIRYSVEKYNGTVTVDLKNNWFELRILLPKQE